VKRGALIRFAVGPDAAAVPRHDLVHEREADTGARELMIMMQALKYAK
jgi:hypothetical protein